MFNEFLRAVLAAVIVCFAVPAAATLPIQHWRTAHGAAVYFVESHELPMLDVAVDFAAGSAYDPAPKAGLAHLAQGLLDQGAGGLSESEIAHRLADVGAVMGGHFDRDRAGVTLRTLSSRRERDQALDVMARVLQAPAYSPAVVEREKKRVIAALVEAEAQPGAVAEKAFYQAVYGSHPYARPEQGDKDAIPGITRDDLLAFHRTHYTAPNAVVAIMGDISRADAEDLAERLTAGLPPGSGVPALPAPIANPAREVRIAHPSAQSHVLIGGVGIARNDPDFFALYVGNYVLGGGGFDSRLLKEIRDRRGYAYSAYSYFAPLAVAGPFTLGLQTKTETTEDALAVARDTLAQFVAEGPSEAELAQARANLVNGFPLRIDSNRKILDYLALIGFYRLPLDYLDTWTARVEAVDVAAVRAAFARRIDPRAMVTVVVGAEPGGRP
jgi:zinc protease